MIEIILFAVSVVGAFVVGFIVGKSIYHNDPVGKLYVVEDPDPNKKPYICSELYMEPATFKNDKYVLFEVNSQK